MTMADNHHHHKHDDDVAVDNSNSKNKSKSGEVRITRPTFLVDKDKCLSNLQNMKSKVDRANSSSNNNNNNQSITKTSNKTRTVRFRPHCKTHASLEVGKWMKEYVGVQCITVSSLTMAKYFSTIFNDITVAFTVNILEIDTINDILLSHDVSGRGSESGNGRPFCLNLLVENVESVQFLQQHLKRPVGIYIKIDCGYGRTGLRAENVEQVADVVRKMIEYDNQNDISRGDGKKLVVWKGLLTHAGQSYYCQTKDEILAVHRSVKDKMLSLRSQLQDMFPNHTSHIEVSIGDTPTCSVVEDVKDDWGGIDEIRPGNFVFYDVEQAQKIGCCSFDDIAVAVACPIVAKHPDRRELILYGGGVHLSKDRCTLRMSPVSNDENGAEGTTKTIYGRVARSLPSSGLKWGDVIDGMYIRSTSQEHGIVVVPPQEDFNSYKIGDIVKVLPVHSCMTADCMCQRGYLTTDGQWISRMKD